MGGIAFFDIDGTLTRGISSGTFIAERLGHGSAMRASCIAIGDSRSDLMLFDAVGASLAFNADQAARERATLALDGTDISEALHYFRR